MKRLWVCTALLAALFAASLRCTEVVRETSETITAALSDAEDAAEAENWETALSRTEEAKDYWEARLRLLALTMRLDDTDEVSTGFQEVLGFLRWQDAPEYESANRRLIAYVEHLAETEEVSWQNFL